MNRKSATIIVLSVATILASWLTTACGAGGHGVDVTIGNNGCSVASCTNQPIRTNVTIH